MTFEKNNPSEVKPLSTAQMNSFKGGAGLCDQAEIFFPNNPRLNDAANYVAHLWQNYKASKAE